jgi:hypothetical protein
VLPEGRLRAAEIFCINQQMVVYVVVKMKTSLTAPDAQKFEKEEFYAKHTEAAYSGRFWSSSSAPFTVNIQLSENVNPRL